MAKLIGTAPNQVPTNADLGDMAYVNKADVGSFKLSGVALRRVEQEISLSSQQVFVYDTSKDSDGGAWRKRTQHTSWYNEEQSSTRGARKDFPAMAVIIATSSDVTIYDADDPTMPEWIRFNYVATGFIYRAPTCVHMLNGVLAVGVLPSVGYQTNYWDGGVKYANFVSDEIRGYAYSQGMRYNESTIADRNNENISRSSNASWGIIDSDVRAVAMTVMPNAPIDENTGLQIPTIAAATDAGISVIKDNGTIVNKTATVGNAYNVSFVLFYNDKHELCGVYDRGYNDNNIPAIWRKNTWDSSYSSFDLGGNAMFRAIPAGSLTPLGNDTNSSNPPLSNGTAMTGRDMAFGSSLGLSQFFIPEGRSGSAIEDQSFANYIASDFNSGLVNPYTRLATLSSNERTSLSSPELITNGTFASNDDNWTDNSTVSSTHDTTIFTNGGMKITVTGSGSTWAYQTIRNLQVGHTYRLQADMYSPSTNTNTDVATIGMAAAGFGGSNSVSNTTTNTIQTRTLYFTATSTTHTIYASVVMASYANWGTSGSVGYFDNISLKDLGCLDRSAEENHLETIGTVARTEVNTGAELSAFGPFSSSNYFKRHYTDDFSVHVTGGLCGMLWVNFSQLLNQHEFLMQFRPESGTGNNWWQFYKHNVGGQLTFYIHNNGTSSSFQTTNSITAGKWHHVAFSVVSGRQRVYIDGRVDPTTGQATTSGAAADSNNIFKIGVHHDQNYAAANAKFALAKISGQAPSDDEMRQIYEAEWPLFQPNAQATLGGWNNNVTGLGYDKDNKLLHVGTGNGRSVFQGLRRVDWDTGTVNGDIAAANGIVAQED